MEGEDGLDVVPGAGFGCDSCAAVGAWPGDHVVDCAEAFGFGDFVFGAFFVDAGLDLADAVEPVADAV